MVALVDERDANRRAGQTMCDLKATEAGAYDHNVMEVRGTVQCPATSDLNRGDAAGSSTMADLAVFPRLFGWWE
ncbi:MAG: hypothetical protein WCF13_04635, partial [Stellaceae bacterium]